MAIPVGVKANNPLNMRPLPGGRQWDGQSGVVSTSVGEFCSFSQAKYGFRAAAKNMLTYLEQGLDTPAKIISTWAPPEDNNNTQAYIENVCTWAGFTKRVAGKTIPDPDRVLNVKQYADAYPLLYSMSRQEQGAPFETYFKPWQLNEGLRLAGVGDVPVSTWHKNVAAVGTGVAAAAAAAPDIQSGIATMAPQVASLPSETLKSLYTVIAFGAGILGIAGIIIARSRGNS